MELKKTDHMMLSLVGSLFLATLLVCVAEGNTHYYEFVLEESNFTRLCSTKSMVTVNNSFPGPVIRVQKGDAVYVNVYNLGSYGVTIHWHGVKQPRNPWFDGPEYVTQCPIQPGANFTYEILFSSEEGTLWWHAHSDWSRSSIHGAIVILPAEGSTYPFLKPDEEDVIVFASWYKEDVMTLMEEALSSGGLATLSDAYTINGQPGDFYECSKNTTYCLVVDYGKTYLLRLVNAVMNTDMFFAIAGHNLTVVAWDAAYLKPFNTSWVLVSPGQTMDILFTANQPLGEYYMIGSPYFDGQADDFDQTITSALLKYSGNYTNPSSAPVYPSLVPAFEDVHSANAFINRVRSLATPKHPIDVPLNVTTRMYIALSMNLLPCPNSSCSGPEGDRLAAAMNNMTFVNPSMDILQAYYRNINGFYQTNFPDWPLIFYNFTSDSLEDDNVTLSTIGTRVKVLNYNESVEVVFQSTNVLNSGEHHPMHLHGVRFYVVGRGVGNFNNVTDPLTYNLYDPPEANTGAVPKDGWMAIRFYANNPGVWFMHCHFDRHMTWGMDGVFIVKDGGTSETSMRPPPAHMPPCDVQSVIGSKQYSDEETKAINSG